MGDTTHITAPYRGFSGVGEFNCASEILCQTSLCCHGNENLQICCTSVILQVIRMARLMSLRPLWNLTHDDFAPDMIFAVFGW